MRRRPDCRPLAGRACSPLAGASPGNTGLPPANSHRADGQANQSQGGNPLRRPTSACCVRAALQLGKVWQCCRPSINCIRCRSALPRDADAIVGRRAATNLVRRGGGGTVVSRMILGEGKASPRSAPNMVSDVSLEERRTVVPSMPARQRRATKVHRRDCGRDPGVVRVVIARTGVHSAGRASNPFYDCLGRSRIVVPTVGRWWAWHARIWQVLLRATPV